MSDQQRQAFEEAVLAEPRWEFADFERSPAVPDMYYNQRLHDMWNGWKLAIASQAPSEGDARDAARYRALRLMTWDKGPLCVVLDPASGRIKLGTDCPSHFRLDEYLDAAIAAEAAAPAGAMPDAQGGAT